MECLDPFKLRNLEMELAEKNATIDRLTHTIESASFLAATVCVQVWFDDTQTCHGLAQMKLVRELSALGTVDPFLGSGRVQPHP